MNLTWYVMNVDYAGDINKLRKCVKYCIRKINSHCLRFICHQNGDTMAELVPRPPYSEYYLKYALELRDRLSLFSTIYKQLLYLQRTGAFVVTPATMDAIDVKLIDDRTILLGVPVIDHEKAIPIGR